jgi:group I intron endonuclease
MEYYKTNDEYTLLSREQFYLDQLFTSSSLSMSYNISTNASAPMQGRTHTEETKAKIGDSLKGQAPNKGSFQAGENNPMFGKVPMRAFQPGENNPMFGSSPTNALIVYVYSALDKSLVTSYTSCLAASKAYGVSIWTIRKYTRSGKVFQGKYILCHTPLLPNQ